MLKVIIMDNHYVAVRAKDELKLYRIGVNHDWNAQYLQAERWSGKLIPSENDTEEFYRQSLPFLFGISHRAENLDFVFYEIPNETKIPKSAIDMMHILDRENVLKSDLGEDMSIRGKRGRKK